MPRSRRWGVRPELAAGPVGAAPDAVHPTGADGSSVDPNGEGQSSYEDTTGRGFEDPIGAGPSSQAGFTDGVHDPDTFSSLLLTHHVKHRVSLVSLEDDVMLTVRHRRSEIMFVPHKEMGRYLLNLRLYQLATMLQSKIDQSLMHGLAERWNWGGAVLAHLYRGLCHACLVKNRQIFGPLLLLQHWSWSHLPVNRPIIPLPHPRWRVPDPDRCPAYGAIWGCHQSYEETGMGVSYVRGQLQMLRDTNINWFPYRPFYRASLLRRLTLDPEQIRLWYYRGPIVCYWIVE